MAVALINGSNYTHKQIVFQVNGVPLTSLSDLTISETTQRDFSYGTGDLPCGYGDGRDEPVNLTFTLSMTEAIALENASPNKDVKKNLPFDIPVTFLNTSKPHLTIIKNVLITGVSTSSDIDNTDIKREFTAIASHLVKK